MNADKGAGSTSKRVLGASIAAVIAAGAAMVYFSLGMPGMDHSQPSTSSHDMAGMTSEARLGEMTSAEFEAAIADQQSLMINVHTPDDGAISGTDLAIPYDVIKTSAKLPKALDQPILLYCRTGRMSKIAGNALIAMGYTNVSHLLGGMDAWIASGRDLITQH